MTEHRKSSLQEAIRALAAEERASLEDDPTSELLDDYLRGVLNDDQRRRLSRRISLDPELASEVLARFERQLADQQQQDWQTLAVRAADEGLDLERESQAHTTTGPVDGRSHQRAVASTARYRLVVGLAAGWILTTIGLGLMIYNLQQHSGVLSLASRELALETRIIDQTLRPESVQRTREGLRPLQVDGATQRLTFTLISTDSHRFPNFRIQLRDFDGTVLIESQDVEPVENGSFILSLVPTALSSGRYEWIVYGQGTSESGPLASYPFVIERVEMPTAE